MESATPSSTPSYVPLTMDRAFFGKDNCLTVQLRGENCFCKWGRKRQDAWEWKTVKFADVELGEMLRVLDGTSAEAAFYHTFGEDKTRIWVSRQDAAVVFKADDFTKGLNAGEQRVLAVLLHHCIWMMNLA